MDPLHAKSEKSVRAIWREHYRFALIDATPMRPGRGRRPVIPKAGAARAAAVRNGSTRRFVWLRADSDQGSSPQRRLARQIHESGLEEFIRIAETRAQVVDAFALLYGLGYYLWRVEEEPENSGADLLRASFATRKELT